MLQSKGWEKVLADLVRLSEDGMCGRRVVPVTLEEMRDSMAYQLYLERELGRAKRTLRVYQSLTEGEARELFGYRTYTIRGCCVACGFHDVELVAGKCPRCRDAYWKKRFEECEDEG